MRFKKRMIISFADSVTESEALEFVGRVVRNGRISTLKK